MVLSLFLAPLVSSARSMHCPAGPLVLGPSNVELLSAGTRTKTNQYSVTEYDTVVHKGEMQMPSVWFSYDISPISVTISETRKSFAHLLTRFCAVVGGVFAVTGTPWAGHHAPNIVPVLDLFLQL